MVGTRYLSKMDKLRNLLTLKSVDLDMKMK